jgi:hypothetical protein
VFTARDIARDHAAQSEEIFRKTCLLKARDGDRAKKLF